MPRCTESIQSKLVGTPLTINDQPLINFSASDVFGALIPATQLGGGGSGKWGVKIAAECLDCCVGGNKGQRKINTGVNIPKANESAARVKVPTPAPCAKFNKSFAACDPGSTPDTRLHENSTRKGARARAHTHTLYINAHRENRRRL